MSEDTVTISRKEYAILLDKSLELNYLENGGVDNWEWYSESLSEYWKQKEEDEE